MGVKIEQKEGQVHIYWNDGFIASWKMEEEIPERLVKRLQSIMREVWLAGERAGAEKTQQELKRVLGIPIY
jgi:hypothetical protein